MTPAEKAAELGTLHGRAAGEAWRTWTPEYSAWRHGGWYVHGTTYANGGTGCVSRNYADRKWRIVCDERENAYERFTYGSRDEAARAEHALHLPVPRTVGDHYDAEMRRKQYGLTDAESGAAYSAAFTAAVEAVVREAVEK